MKASVTSMQGMASAEDTVAKKTEILGRSIEAGKQKLSLIQGQYDRAKEKLDQLGKALEDAKREFGENSEQALKAENAYNKQAKTVNDLGTQLHKTQADVNDMTRELQEMENEERGASNSSDKLEHELKDVGDAADKAGQHGTKLGTIFKGAFFANIATQALSKLTSAMKNVASSIIEVTAEHNASMASYHQIVGDYATEADAALKKLSQDTGLYASLLRGDFTQNLSRFKGLGLDIADATERAAQATRLAADAAAFNDKTYEEAAESIASFINGQYRAGQAIKIFANDAQLASFAVEKGLISQTKEWSNLSEAQKQAARLDYAEQFYELSGVLGQSKRESGEWLIVTQNLRAAWEELLAKIGGPILQALTPVLQNITEKLTALVDKVDWEKFGNTVESILNFIIENGKAVAASLGIIAVGFAAASAAASPLTLVAIALAAIVIQVGLLKTKLEDLLGIDVPGWAAAIASSIGGGPLTVLVKFGDAMKEQEKTAHGWEATNLQATQLVTTASLEMSRAWASAMENMKAKMSEMAANAKAKAAEIAQRFVALPGQMLQIGADIVSGLWQGIKTRSQWLIQQIKTFCQSVVNSIKGFFKIASPSKVMRDEVGKQITAGMALGIKAGTPTVKKAMQGTGITVLQIADGILSKLEAKEEEMTRLLNSSETDEVAKSVLKTQQEQLKQYVSDFSKAIDEIRKKQDTLTDKLRGYGNLMQTITSDKNGSSLGGWGGAVGMQNEIDRLEKYSDLLEQIKALNLGDDFMADFLATDIDEAIDYAEKLLMLPDKMREEYLALRDQQKALAASVDEARKREKTEETILADLSEQTEAIKEYGDLLEELKNAGAPKSLVSEVTSMGVDDATVYMKKLLGLTDEGLDEYISLWNEKQETAARIAERFYKQESEAIVAEFAEKLPDELADMQDDFFRVGQDAGHGLADGILSMVGTVTAAAKKVAKSARDAIQTQEEIHSPSQKWADLGGYMAAGVAQGFNRTMASISSGIMSSVQTVRTSDLERVGSGIVNGMAVSGTGGYGGRIEVPLVINGREFARAVLTDLRAVQKASPEVAYG